MYRLAFDSTLFAARSVLGRITGRRSCPQRRLFPSGAFLLLLCHSTTLQTLHLIFFLARPSQTTSNALPAAVRPHHQHTRRSQLEMAQQIVTPPEVALSHKPLRRYHASTIWYSQLPRRVSSDSQSHQSSAHTPRRRRSTEP